MTGRARDVGKAFVGRESAIVISSETLVERGAFGSVGDVHDSSKSTEI